MKLENIRIVMVGTTHPGNIGAAARALKNMGLDKLHLVDPQCPIGEIAYSRASGANGILDQRKTWSKLEEAISDCEYVFATSARHRSLSWPELKPFELAQKLTDLDDEIKVAVVFGREHSGLTNEEIQASNAMIVIPTNPDFSSLNIASAIQVICYEIFRQLSIPAEAVTPDIEDEVVAQSEVEGYIKHLEQVLEISGFLNPDQPGLIMQRLRRLYQRSELTRNEVNILRGMLTAIEKKLD